MGNKLSKAIAAALMVLFLLITCLPVYAADTVYKKGDKNGVIAEAQKSLKQLGFFNEECTGYFGDATEKAVKAFQKKYKLGVDGKLGPTTISWLKKLTPDSGLTSRSQSQRDVSKSGVKYVVKKGDTLWDIANSCNVTPESIQKANNLDDSTVLQIGQELIIPGTADTVKPEVSGSSENTQAANTESTSLYIVKKGDTLWSIAEDYGVTVEELQQLNKLDGDSILQIGQEIRIPETGENPPEVSVNPPEDSTNPSEANVSPSEGADTSDEKKASATPAPGKGEYLDWFGVVDKMFKNGDIATVTDVDTGKSFKVRRLYGKNHADVEPLTADDTAVMKIIYGEWSWDRRAIIVTIGDRNIAASMNGMPHGGEEILDNDFDGQFCIHFKGSKTHAGNKVDPGHQAAVKKAAGLD